MKNTKIEDTFVAVPGGTVYVRQWTPETISTDAPMVLLHDSLGCVDLWRDFPGELALSLQRPVLAYDRLGFGKSTARSGLPAINFIEEEAEIYFPAVRNALGFASFSLFGHSVGGGMALMIAAAQGGNCELVVTESAQAFVEQRTRDGIMAAKELFQSPEQLKKLAKWHGDKAQWVLAAWTETWLSPEFSSWSLIPSLGKVLCPVLAIHGDLDEYGSLEFPRSIVSNVKGPAQMAILEQCGHVPHREQQAKVLQLVASFIAMSCQDRVHR
jgi:pimeloyl-ACP methyl ester carboxylesterase